MEPEVTEKPKTTTTKSQEIATDVAALLRARNPLLWVVTREEARVERYLFEAAAAAGYIAKTWDVASGIAEMDGKLVNSGQDPGEALNMIRERATGGKERGVWIMRDLPAWLSGPAFATTLRQVRNLARMLPGIRKESSQAMIVLTPSADVPPELAGHATVIEWPLPDRSEIAALVDQLAEQYKLELNGQRDNAIDAAVGLTFEEAQACYSKSIVQLRKIDPAMVAKEKKRVIARERVLEWFDPLPGGLDAVGGLENMKEWFMARSAAYTPAARAYGLPMPRGALLVGISGCGKSLTAKAISTAWQCPLLRMDLGALKSKFVGESEKLIRQAQRVVETVGRCVVWLDEVEKGLQGATSGSADGGVSSDALGSLLSWMQERKGEAFIIATANDISGLPAEFLRKGRFDEIWFIDLPTRGERGGVLKAALREYGRDAVDLDYGDVVDACEGFTGAEIAALVPDALFAAFADNGREIETGDLLAAAKTVVPLSKTASEKITKLREWAKDRARPATKAETKTQKASKRLERVLDI
jgi:SpoVK/Ycf46/Vps4 family AAA+-type ATPase